MANSSIDPRYPIGPHPSPESVDVARVSEYIAGIAALPENLRSAVEDLSGAQLDTPYREGGWTVRQVVHHVADSHMHAYLRMKLALTESWPVIAPYKEKLWAEMPDSRTLPVEVSLELLEPLHRRWVAMLKAIPAGDWERGYTHPERGRVTLLQAAALYDWHSRHHVAHVMELRKSRGW
ncbi:MAG: YfiT family bacillithiol transferase [Acidobacteriaceae bacterium]